jgi:hypothetical protein
MAARLHQFSAVAFEENLSLRQFGPVFPQARISAHELYLPIEPAGGMYAYPFGAVVRMTYHLNAATPRWLGYVNLFRN